MASTVIPVVPEVKLGYGVYYAPTWPPLSEADLVARVPPWIAAHVPAPLGPALLDFIAQRPLIFNDMLKTALALPPVSWLHEEAGFGGEEERRFNAAVNLLVISTSDPNQVPRFGLWSVLAAAACCAEVLDGVGYDHAAVRFLPVSGPAFPALGEIVVTNHISVRAETDTRARAFVRTRGMEKFGLPDLWLPGDGALIPLVAGVAQALLDAMLHAAHAAGAPVSKVAVDKLTVGSVAVRLGYRPDLPLQILPLAPAPA